MNIFVRLFFTTFDVDKLNNSASMNLIQFLAMKLHQGPVFINGMVNSTELVVHSKTNFVKVVQNQFLSWKTLMLCPNWYCKIVLWPRKNLTYRSKKSIDQNGKRASTIGSNACKSVWILMGNILKNNKAIIDD